MWTSSGFLILKSEMAAYGTVLLVVLTTDIAGVKSEWLCNNICCAGAFSLGSKKCEKLRPCSDTGQYIIRAGNEIQDNKCWCDEGKGFSPIRPKLCWEKSEACRCLQCPEGSKPNVIDKNGQYVEHFDKDKHCKRMCEPTGNTYEGGIGIGIGIAIVIAVIIVVWFIPWIYYCRRYNKYTFPLKFMPIDSHKNALRDKGNARKDVISMGKFVLDETLITKFEECGILSKEDTEKWIKDTFKKIQGRYLPEAREEEVLILRDLEASKGIDGRPFPSGERLRCITKPDEFDIIRGTAIDVLKDILRSKSVEHEPSTLLNCLDTCLDYRYLANRLRAQPTSGLSRSPSEQSVPTIPIHPEVPLVVIVPMTTNHVEVSDSTSTQSGAPLGQPTVEIENQTAPSTNDATGQTALSTNGATGQTAPSTNGATGQTAPSTNGATGQTAPSTNRATGPLSPGNNSDSGSDGIGEKSENETVDNDIKDDP